MATAGELTPEQLAVFLAAARRQHQAEQQALSSVVEREGQPL